MSAIKAGVIGLGFIGPAHVEALRRLGGVEVIAVAGSRPGPIAGKAAPLRIPRAYDTWQALIADPDVQVVHNCTPNFLHHPINMAAIRAGKGIVSEKPLAMDARQSAELLRAATDAGVIHAVCFNNRMYPLTREMRARVAAGNIGDVWLVHGHYLQDWLLHPTDYNWRVNPTLGGAARTAGDIGSHWCDLAEFITGQPITALYANLLTFLPTRLKPPTDRSAFDKTPPAPDEREAVTVRTDDCGMLMLRFEGDARGICLLSQLCAGRKNQLALEVNGSRGSLGWNLEQPNTLWLGHRERPNEILPKDPTLLGPEAQPYAHYPGWHNEGYPDSFKNLFRDVYAAAREGSGMPPDPLWPTFQIGHRANVVVDAILQSAAENRWVNVPH